MAVVRESTCPGCGLRMPVSDRTIYEGYYNASPECWGVYTEVLGAEFGNAVLFGQVHQLTVDAYAAQHPGGIHPDKSVAVHLTGLHLVLDRGVAPTSVARQLQSLALTIREWPHFTPPADRGRLTVCDVALSDDADGHIKSVREWAGLVWRAWGQHHGAVAALVTQHLSLERTP
jgi:hypothetical protein